MPETERQSLRTQFECQRLVDGKSWTPIDGDSPHHAASAYLRKKLKGEDGRHKVLVRYANPKPIDERAWVVDVTISFRTTTTSEELEPVAGGAQ